MTKNTVAIWKTRGKAYAELVSFEPDIVNVNGFKVYYTVFYIPGKKYIPYISWNSFNPVSFFDAIKMSKESDGIKDFVSDFKSAMLEITCPSCGSAHKDNTINNCY